MHTIVGGAVGTPSMVLVPGYGAGAGFFFRNMRALCSHFRVHAVDLLGTGLSGASHISDMMNFRSWYFVAYERYDSTVLLVFVDSVSVSCLLCVEADTFV